MKEQPKLLVDQMTQVKIRGENEREKEREGEEKETVSIKTINSSYEKNNIV